MDPRDRDTTDDARATAGGPDPAPDREDGPARPRRRRRNRRGEPGDATTGSTRNPVAAAGSGQSGAAGRDPAGHPERPVPPGGARRPGSSRPEPSPRPESSARPNRRPTTVVRAGVPFIETLGGRGLSGSDRVPNTHGEVTIRPDNRTLPEAPSREVCVARRALLPQDYPVLYRPYSASRRLDAVLRRDDGALLLCDGSHDGPHRWPDQWPDQVAVADASDRPIDADDRPAGEVPAPA